MAEPVGLMIGGIGLAALFTTCIDCLDYISLGRNHSKDYELSLIKMALLKTRLDPWGKSLRISEDGEVLPAFRNRWPQERELVGRCLMGIKALFDDSEKLEKKYGLYPSKPEDDTVGSSAFQQIEDRFRFGVKNRHKSTSTWRKTAWAVHDKKKFDSLITDVAFYIDGLEKLSESLHVLGLQRQLVINRIQEVTNMESIALLEEATAQSHTSPLTSPLALEEETGSDVSRTSRGHVYIGTAIKDRAKVLNGNLGLQGHSLSRHTFKDTRASDDAHVVQGDMLAEAGMTFFR
jgi:hypothetical protein